MACNVTVQSPPPVLSGQIVGLCPPTPLGRDPSLPRPVPSQTHLDQKMEGLGAATTAPAPHQYKGLHVHTAHATHATHATTR